MNSSATPIKGNHKILYSTRNNTFLRNKKFFEKQAGDASPDLNLNLQSSERIFRNNQLIAQRLLDTKSRSTYRAPSFNFADPVVLDSLKSSMLSQSALYKGTIKVENRRNLARTLSVGQASLTMSPSISAHLKSQGKPRFSHLSSINEPISELITNKNDEEQPDSVNLIKQIKAVKRFEEDRKKARSIYKHKTDISYLTDNRRSNSTFRELQINEFHTGIQSQPISPHAENDESTKNFHEEQIIRHPRTLASLSPTILNERTPNSSITDLVSIVHRRQGHKYQTEISPNYYRASFNILDPQKGANGLTNIPSMQNNVLLAPLMPQTSFFSKGVDPENQVHEGITFNLENVQASGYASGFKEVASGFKLRNSLQKISDLKGDGKLSSDQLKLKLDESPAHSLLALDLRRELPNTLSGAPSSRNDAVILCHWMEAKLKATIESAHMDEKQKRSRCDEIYNIGLNEIIRQVGLDCAERAETLNKIWMSYLRMFQQFKLSLIADQAKARNEQDEAYNQTIKMYKNLLGESKDQRAQLEKQLNDLTLEHMVIKNEYERLVKTDSANLQKNRELRKMMKNMVKQLEKAQEENHIIHMRLNAKTGSQSIKQESESPKKMHFSNNSPTQSKFDAKRKNVVGRNSNAQAIYTDRLEKRGDDSDVSISEISSANLEYEMNEEREELGPKEHVHKIEQLNTLALVHAVPDIIKYFDHREVQTGEDLYGFGHHNADCQTDLKLVDANYDALFASQNQVDDLVTENKLKKEVDALASTQPFDVEAQSPASQGNTPQKLAISASEVNTYQQLEPKEEIQRLKPINQIQDLASHDAGIEANNEDETKGVTSRKKDSTRRHRNNGLTVFSAFSSAKDLPQTVKNNHSTVKNKLDPSKRLEESSSPLEPISINEFSPGHKLYGSINTELNINSPLIPTKKSVRMQNTQNNLEHESAENSSNYPEATSNQHSSNDVATGEGETQINLDELDPSQIYNSEDDEKRSNALDQDSFSTILEDEEEDAPIQRIPEKKRSSNPKTNQGSRSSFSRVAERLLYLQYHRKKSKIWRASIREKRKANGYKTANMSEPHPLFSVASVKPQIDLLLNNSDFQRTPANSGEATPVNLTTEKHMQIIRMYKVENEKSKLLQKNLDDLKLFTEKERQNKDTLELENIQLKAQIADVMAEIEEYKLKLENSIKKCEHGGCPICLEEEEKAAERRERELEEEDAVEELEKIKSKSRLKKQQNSKKVIPQNMIFGRRNAVEKKDNPAPAIISKLRVKKMSQFKNFMPLKMVLKQMNSIYEERMRLSRESTIIKEEDLSCFIYNMFLNQFGFKKIAEQKFIVFILSVKKYLHIIRINLFARFLGLIEGAGNYSVDELNKYTECLDFLSTNTLGINIPSTDTDSKQYSPYVRFQEYLKTFAENKLGVEEYIDFKKDFEAMKESDPKNVNRLGIIDIDMAMMKVLAKYKLTNNRIKQYLIDAFSFVDLNGDKLCDLREFKLLMRYLEPEKYDEAEIEQIFEEYTEVMTKEGVPGISYDQFTVMCVEQNWFSEYQQDKFLMITKKEQIAERFHEVFKNWPTIRDEMETCLRNSKSLSSEDKQKWNEYVDLLWKRVLNPALSDKERKPLLVVVSVFEEELKKLA